MVRFGEGVHDSDGGGEGVRGVGFRIVTSEGPTHQGHSDGGKVGGGLAADLLVSGEVQGCYGDYPGGGGFLLGVVVRGGREGVAVEGGQHPGGAEEEGELLSKKLG